MSATVSFDDVEVIGATEKAIRVRFDDGREEWCPQSQVHEDSEVWKRGDTGTLVVTEWWATRAGLA